MGGNGKHLTLFKFELIMHLWLYQYTRNLCRLSLSLMPTQSLFSSFLFYFYFPFSFFLSHTLTLYSIHVYNIYYFGLCNFYYASLFAFLFFFSFFPLLFSHQDMEEFVVTNGNTLEHCGLWDHTIALVDGGKKIACCVDTQEIHL